MANRRWNKTHNCAGHGAGKDASSAFVFGQRGDAGAWKFYAQVVKGNMSNPSEIDLTDDLQIPKFPRTGEAMQEL